MLVACRSFRSTSGARARFRSAGALGSLAWVVLYFVGFAYIGETADTANTNGEVSKTQEATSPNAVVLLFITDQKMATPSWPRMGTSIGSG